MRAVGEHIVAARNASRLKLAGPTITEAQAVAAIEAGAHQSPPSPRLWRLAEVMRWAAAQGRVLLHESGSSKS